MVPVPCLMYSTNLVADVSRITDVEKNAWKVAISIYFHWNIQRKIFHPSPAAVLWTMSHLHIDTNTTDL